eukprot:853552_1
MLLTIILQLMYIITVGSAASMVRPEQLERAQQQERIELTRQLVVLPLQEEQTDSEGDASVIPPAVRAGRKVSGTATGNKRQITGPKRQITGTTDSEATRRQQPQTPPELLAGRDASRETRDRSRDRSQEPRDRSWDRSQEPRDRSWETRDRSRDPRDRSREPRDRSRDRSQEPRDRSWETRDRSRDPRDRSREPRDRSRDRSQEPRDRSWDRSQEPRDRSWETRDRSRDPRDRSREPRDRRRETTDRRPQNMITIIDQMIEQVRMIRSLLREIATLPTHS